MNLFDKYRQLLETSRTMAYRESRNESNKTHERYAVRMFSEILRCHIWVVQDEEDMKAMLAAGVSEAIYTAQDIRFLKGANNEELKAIQAIKEEFPKSIIESRKEDRGSER